MRLSSPAPNNGTHGVMFPVFVNPPSYHPTIFKQVQVCTPKILKCGDSCFFEVNNPSLGSLSKTLTMTPKNFLQLPLSDVPQCYPSHSVGFPPDSGKCQVNFCNGSIVFNEARESPVVAEVLLMDKISNLDFRGNCSLKFDFDPELSNDTNCAKKNFSNTMSLFPENSEFPIHNVVNIV